MSTFSAKGSDVDVEAIMANIRRKIDDKRKGLYTEDEVREIAEMKLDAVLDANEFNSDFVAAFRARDEKWNYSFNPETIYASSRGGQGGLVRLARRLLHPVLKLLFNPNPIISALSRQSELNRYYVQLLHNMAQEMTQMSLELTNLKARLRTLGIRVDFQTKREKTLEQLTTTARENRESRPARPPREEREGRREREGRGARDNREGRQDRDSREARDSKEGREAREGRDSRESRGEAKDSNDGRRRGRGGRRSYRRRRGGGGGGSGSGGSGSGGSGSGGSSSGGGGGRGGGGRGSSSPTREGSGGSGG